MVFIWLAIALSGFFVALVASRGAIQHASMLAYGSRVSPFVIGVVFVSVGTDIPEIANSVLSSLAGHGDLNVGDSVGSVVTQITLVLGLLPFASGSFVIGPGRVALASALTVVSLAVGAWLVADGDLSRLDAAVLVTMWAVATVVLWRYAPPLSEPELTAPTRHKAYHAAVVIAGLAAVGAGAGVVVKAITELAVLLGIPEYLISFFGSSVGTSLPELIVDITAVRSGRRDIAIGDVVGSCLVDATLSIWVGPLVAPTAVTAALAVRGAAAAVVVMIVASLIVGLRRRHDRLSGALLLLLYAAVYVVLIAPR